MKRYVILVLAVLLTSSARLAAWPTVFPTGTTLYDPARAFDSYTLFTPVNLTKKGQISTMYLINMRGDVVHRWKVPFWTVQGKLLPNGNIMITGHNDVTVVQGKKTRGTPDANKSLIPGGTGWLIELDWNSNVVFQHLDLNMHHDFIKLPNGHYMYLAWERVPKALQARVRGGIKGSEFADGTMYNDYIVEINRQGEVVWEWHANEHLDPDIDIMGPSYTRVEWLHANSLAVLKNGNIAIIARNTDSLIIIDKKTGRILTRWGNTAYYDKTTRQIEYRAGATALGGAHGVNVIPDGYPGMGNLILYDNGVYTSESRWVEIGVAHGLPRTGLPVASSPGQRIGRRHYSWAVGYAERLPNGNTLVCDGANGRFFQQTPGGTVVWEYVNPYIGLPALQGAVFRALAYAPDFCPQLKTLPPAGGSAIVASSSMRSEEPVSEEQNNIALTVLIAAVSALVAFLLGWQLARKR